LKIDLKEEKGRELDTDYIKKLKAEKEKLEKSNQDKPEKKDHIIKIAPMTEKERIEKIEEKKKAAWK